jgi:hypothetical protein
MTGNWYFNILNRTDPEEIDAIIELLFRPENDRVRLILSKYCDTREEMAINAKMMFGLKYTKDGKIEYSTMPSDEKKPIE